jgi:hypothetical protein
MSSKQKILFCNCAYAQVVPAETKSAVLRQLCASNASFDAVADLCEMAARRDPRLQALAAGGELKIAACFPRAVKWLFAQANAPLALDSTEALNMRVDSPEAIGERLFASDLIPNLPAGKEAPERPSTLDPVEVAPAQSAA